MTRPIVVLAIGFIASVLGAANPAVAAALQDPTCKARLSIGDCADSLRAQLRAKAAKSSDDAKKKLDTKTTGPETPIEDNATAIKNFLPGLATAISSKGLTDDQRKALGLQLNGKLYNTRVHGFGPSGQLSLVINAPTVSDEITKAIPKARRADVSDSLKNLTHDYDNLKIAGSINAETPSLGRGFSQYADEVSRLAIQVLAGPEDAAATAVQKWLTANPHIEARISSTRAAAAECKGRDSDLQLDCFDESTRAAIVSSLLPLVNTLLQTERDIDALSKRYHLDRIGDLVNNQPQLNASIEWNARTKLVGGSTVVGKLRLERGGADWNEVRAYCREHRSANPPADLITPTCFRQYMDQDGVTQNLNNSGRAFAEVSVSYQPKYDFTMLADTVSIHKVSDLSGGAKIGWGEYFGPANAGDNRPRIDIAGTLNVIRKDSKRQQQYIGTLTFTQPMANKLQSYIALNWADKADLLGDVNKNLRTNVGLSYRLGSIDDKK